MLIISVAFLKEEPNSFIMIKYTIFDSRIKIEEKRDYESFRGFKLMTNAHALQSVGQFEGRRVIWSNMLPVGFSVIGACVVAKNETHF